MDFLATGFAISSGLIFGILVPARRAVLVLSLLLAAAFLGAAIILLLFASFDLQEIRASLLLSQTRPIIPGAIQLIVGSYGLFIGGCVVMVRILVAKRASAKS